MKKLATTSLIAAVLIGGAASYAQSTSGSATEQTLLSQEEAKAIALGQVAGQVDDLELEKQRNGQVYEITIVQEDGSKKEVEIDAHTGKVLEIENEHDKRGKWSRDGDGKRDGDCKKDKRRG